MKTEFSFLLVLFVMCAAGCGSSGSGNLPADTQLAVRESSQAIRMWINLLNEGKGTDFLVNALPDYALNDSNVRNAGGGFTPEFLGKFYEVLPDLHTSLQQALLLQPHIKGENVIYDFPVDSPGHDLFTDGKMYLSRTGDKWHFNGPKLRR